MQESYAHQVLAPTPQSPRLTRGASARRHSEPGSHTDGGTHTPATARTSSSNIRDTTIVAVRTAKLAQTPSLRLARRTRNTRSQRLARVLRHRHTSSRLARTCRHTISPDGCAPSSSAPHKVNGSHAVIGNTTFKPAARTSTTAPTRGPRRLAREPRHRHLQRGSYVELGAPPSARLAQTRSEQHRSHGSHPAGSNIARPSAGMTTGPS